MATSLVRALGGGVVARLALLLLLLLAGAAAAQADAPTLTAGDQWTYLGPDHYVHQYVEAIEDNTLRMVRHDLPRTEEGPAPTETILQLRADDLAFLSREVYLYGPEGPTDELQEAEHASEPCAHHRWPLEAGAEWTTRCVTDHNKTTTHHRVVGRESVLVPAGTFDAWLIENREQDAQGALLTRDWYAASVCGLVRSTWTTDGIEEELVLTSAACAAATPDTPAAPTPLPGALALLALALVTMARRR